MCLKETELAYLAGLCDGEAYFGIKKSTWQMRHGYARSPLYSERVQIKMTNTNGIKTLKKQFGGRFYKEPRIYFSKKGFKPRKQLYVWQATDCIAVKLILAIQPYLKIKNKQAKLILKLRDSKNNPRARKRGNLGGRSKGKGKPMLPSVLKYREKLYAEVKHCNWIG